MRRLAFLSVLSGLVIVVLSSGAARAQLSQRSQELLEKLKAGAQVRVAAVDAWLAAMIDHTALKPGTTDRQILKLCAEAREYRFASVCVNPGWVELAARALRGTPVKVCTVVGFPLGATTTRTKARETAEAIAHGAGEIDMVLSVDALKSGDTDRVRNDIRAVVRAARGRLVKVILETCLLSCWMPPRPRNPPCAPRPAAVTYVSIRPGGHLDHGPAGPAAREVDLGIESRPQLRYRQPGRRPS